MIKLCEYTDDSGTYEFFMYTDTEIYVSISTVIWLTPLKLNHQKKPSWSDLSAEYIPLKARQMCEQALELDLFI